MLIARAYRFNQTKACGSQLVTLGRSLLHEHDGKFSGNNAGSLRAGSVARSYLVPCSVNVSKRLLIPDSGGDSAGDSYGIYESCRCSFRGCFECGD